MKYFKLEILLVVLIIMGSFSGIYAINQVQHDNNSTNISENNNVTDGAKTIYVAKNGTDRNDGLTPERPKRNIEIALGVANPGDTIRVGPGTYYNNLQINKNITLIGDNQNNTIIDGQQADHCIGISHGVTVRITNFTLKNGKPPQYNDGGGISNDGVLTLENLTITNNTSYSGGGIANYHGTITISRVIIENNSASFEGGGIYNEWGSLTIEDSNITNNSAPRYDGGGISNDGTITISRVTIANNRASYGGGIANFHELTIEDSRITNNTAGAGSRVIPGSGGGICNLDVLHIYGSTIDNNIATHGGGIFNSNINTGPRAYIDDSTIMIYNRPNNFEGVPFIPA